MKEILRQRARELGFDECRFTSAAPPATAPRFEAWLRRGFQARMAWLDRGAARRRDPALVLPGARSIIALSVSYDRGAGAGPVARYARFADYHEIIGARLRELESFLQSMDPARGRSLGYVDTGPVLERDLSARAGLGFIGKHTNLVSRPGGNWVFLAVILTPLEFEPDAPEPGRCGRCVRCIEACPTGAISAPYELDARRCLSYLTIESKDPIPVEFRQALGGRVFGCDTCLEACPWNRFARQGRLMAAHARPDLDAPRLLEWLELDEAGFERQFAGTPLHRTGRRRLARNLCVALGNTAGKEALPALERASASADPMIAEHADWARDQILGRGRAG